MSADGPQGNSMRRNEDGMAPRGVDSLPSPRVARKSLATEHDVTCHADRIDLSWDEVNIRDLRAMWNTHLRSLIATQLVLGHLPHEHS